METKNFFLKRNSQRNAGYNLNVTRSNNFHGLETSKNYLRRETKLENGILNIFLD